MPTAFSHVGVCVSQLERSIAFYRDGLGFSLAERHEIGSQFAALMELDEVELASQF
ncbi:MAG: VOC family protein, partial [Actinomycetota bacterium]